MPKGLTIALGGNPNTGKSTIFNGLTGMNQHTGNWPGKTIALTRGSYDYQGQNFTIVDLPGTYSLLAHSPEEQIARDFLCLSKPDATIIVIDVTCLERNLNLVLQVMGITSKVIVCANFMDEATQLGLGVNLHSLEQELGVPVIPTIGITGEGLPQLKDALARLINGQLSAKPFVLTSNLAKAESGNVITSESAENIVSTIYQRAEQIAAQVIVNPLSSRRNLTEKLDAVFTSRLLGIPIMLFLLIAVFWLTLQGANYPSELLARFFQFSETHLTTILTWLHTPIWLHNALVFGVYRGLTWVIAVMLPPMAIFFPLFTLLEDFGYLPRVAFNLDRFFRLAGTHGKQALTMAMGFGCNAAGVISCRIINSPRDRLVAILTNSLMPCNGRFPILFIMSTIIAGFVFSSEYLDAVATLVILFAIILAVTATFLVSPVLTSTILKGEPAFFVLELPPYRRPHLRQVLYRSFLSRTLVVLTRAVIVAAPAGLLLWILANTTYGDVTLIAILTNWLQPFGKLLGLDGVILLAFILGLPANEIVIPIMLMIYLQQAVMLPLEGLGTLTSILVKQGWTALTAWNFIILTLFHWPCATTLLTIKQETGHWRWAILAAVIPTLLGFSLCFLTNVISKLFT